MKNTFGSYVTVTLSGESHGEYIIATLDGIMSGAKIDEEYIASRLSLRRPSGKISTARQEGDEFKIVSGVFCGRTTGAPITLLIKNSDKRSGDYKELLDMPRPSHADLTANEKYRGYQDYRGGGHFSGRVTVGLVAAGAICQSILLSKGIKLATHISSCAGISDSPFSDLNKEIESLSEMSFPVISGEAGERMKEEIEKAGAQGDSVGGTLQTAVTGLPAGVGEPWFDSVESTLSHILFSIPAVKGVSFGIGFSFADMRGSEANDPFTYENGRVVTKTNNNGGINGGITNGMPIIFNCVIKPTPSISIEQDTVSLSKKENATLSVKGRHDPCIVHRAASVVNACTAIALLDLLASRYGTDLIGL